MEEFVVNSEDCEEEFASEREVELRILANKLSDQGEDIKHAEFEVLIWRVFLPRVRREVLIVVVRVW